MIRGLPFSQLPKTIQDAIVFTRKLGFRYLWVDALCILQSEGPHDTSHQEDWSHETTRFGYYYQNSAITIAATGARSSDDGLFLPRPALAFDPNPVILRRKGPTGETRDISILPNVPSWISEIKRAPLYERGWAIQERILSARVVHFAANMILWECHERRATEIDHVGSSLNDRSNGMVYEEVSDFMPIVRKLQLQGGSASQVVREWYSFIEGYTSAKFTFMGDRLPALSGISALIQRHIPDCYGAGLWQSAVPEGLAWLIEDKLAEDIPDPVSPPATTTELKQMLPSWSWAASRGTVRFPSSLESWEPVLRMEDWDVKSAGVDTSGQILSARLRVRSAFKNFSASELGFKSSAELFSQLTNFIRSPTWITAEYGQAFASEGRETKFTEEKIKLFQSDKSALLNYRRKLLDGATKGFDIYYKDTDMQKQASIANKKLTRERLQNNEEICSKLIPDFEFGCRRVSLGNGYLESLIKPNTKAIFDEIKCVDESGILDNNNIQHDFDIIICATGFDVSHRPAFPVLGRGGQNLGDVRS
ncbi:hypothetical protein FPSE_10684 [Fusarium pseudograminearum CS3096]|uniref:Heterokaryon incompatibility domain-containing protein n=1 Tax=Fusarium pseudograminearum (strain CS3096) TaxID=1028729 RepID=K3VXM1_FUSPC|nr:hypothetical protein FPSE_10684 [Fusarium pseudograminearum CS3096]EKJ69140.1 hypothetical protein FPSE_10684 [Fusarium pseudograminearum CS3096]